MSRKIDSSNLAEIGSYFAISSWVTIEDKQGEFFHDLTPDLKILFSLVLSPFQFTCAAKKAICFSPSGVDIPTELAKLIQVAEFSPCQRLVGSIDELKYILQDVEVLLFLTGDPHQ